MKRFWKWFCFLISAMTLTGGIILLTNIAKESEMETAAGNEFRLDIATKSYKAGSSETAYSNTTSRVNNGNCFSVTWYVNEGSGTANFDKTVYFNGTSDNGKYSTKSNVSSFYYYYDNGWGVRRCAQIHIGYMNSPNWIIGWKFCGIDTNGTSSTPTNNYLWYKYGNDAPSTSRPDWSPPYISGTCYVVYRWNYNLVFNANGGHSSPSSQQFLSGTSTTITSKKPIRYGYTFLGWSRDKNATSASYIGGDDFTDNSSDTGDTITLYAVWKPNTYQVSFNKNDTLATGSMTNQTFTYDVSQNLKSNTFTKTGYHFAGWATSSTGSVVYANGASVKNLARDNGDIVRLYAKWEANSYTIKFNGNGNTGGSMTNLGVTYDKVFSITNKFTRTGYTFSGWYSSSTYGLNTTTARRGTSSTNCNTTWNGSKTTNQYYKNLTTTNNGKVTFYAQWTPITYTVKFDGNGNTGGSMTNQTFTYDASQNLKSNGFTKTGYTFAGWATSETGSKVYSNNQSVKNLTDANGGTVTLYAKWTPNTYTIQYNSNAPSGAIVIETITNSTTATMSNSTMTYDLSATLRQNTYAAQGYYFIGWSTTKMGVQNTIPSSGIYKDQQSVKNLATSGTKVLYAVWLNTWANKTNNVVPSGSGAETSPYIIDSPQDLAWMVYNGTTQHFKQTAPIDMSDYYWYPIGTSAKNFTGYYDGQGYEIINLKIPSITNANGEYIYSNLGLFGYVGGNYSSISRVYLKNAVVYGKTNVGLIAGNISGKATLSSNIIEDSELHASSTSGSYGAIAGVATSGTTIKYNLVYITSSGKTTTNGLYSGTTTLRTNLIEKNNTRKNVGTQDLSGWGKVNNRILPSAISWGAQVLSATSSDLTAWVNKTIL